MNNSVFKTEEGRDKFRAYYTNLLSQFPFDQRYVQTTSHPIVNNTLVYIIIRIYYVYI